MLALASEQVATRAIVCAGAGSFELAHITLMHGIHLAECSTAAESLLERWPEIADRKNDHVPAQGFDQSGLELRKAGLDVP